MKTTRGILLVLAGALLAACGDGSTDPPGQTVPENELVFIRSAAGAPPLVTTDTSFWVKAKDGREVRIPYVNGQGCLEFKVPGDALLRRPDGSAIQSGDSVRITIRHTDSGRFSFEFLPSGLQFNPSRPAELRIRYQYADPDLNGDGRVDSADDRFDFGIWRQEASAQPWANLISVRDASIQEVRATITGFTKFAVAGN